MFDLSYGIWEWESVLNDLWLILRQMWCSCVLRHSLQHFTLQETMDLSSTSSLPPLITQNKQCKWKNENENDFSYSSQIHTHTHTHSHSYTLSHPLNREWDFRLIESGPRSAYFFQHSNLTSMITDGAKVVVATDAPGNLNLFFSFLCYPKN
jgi:hypothetical protein